MPFPPADDAADTLVVHAVSFEEFCHHMWDLGFEVSDHVRARHAVITQLPGRQVVVLLDEDMGVIYAESSEGIATEEDIRQWHKERAKKEVAPRN